eukprot:343581_1
MAHGLLDEGVKTPESNTDSELLTYLKKFKLPVQNFIDNDVAVTDLKNFNCSYFDEMCKDLKLNTIQKIRFKKLIKQLNTNEDIGKIEQEICETFDRLTNDLQKRKLELIDELHRISESKLNSIKNLKHNDVKTNIKFIYDDSILKKTIFKFGIIDSELRLKPPKIVASLILNGIKINLKQYDNVKSDEDTELIIEYKKWTDLENWKVIRNSLIITNIEPLTTYCIRAKYRKSDIWSACSETIRITSELDCIWDKVQHRNTVKTLQFIDNHKIYCSTECATTAIVSKPIFDADLLKKVKFEFIINEFCQTSLFGLISTPISKTMNGYWKHHPVSNNKYALILETMDGLKSVCRHKFGKNIDNSFFSSAGIVLSNKIKKGDHFIFDIDFDTCSCNVYLNIANEANIISKKTDIATWTNIPKQFVAVYGHSASKLVKKSSAVQLNLISYDVR